MSINPETENVDVISRRTKALAAIASLLPVAILWMYLDRPSGAWADEYYAPWPVNIFGTIGLLAAIGAFLSLIVDKVTAWRRRDF